MGLARCKARCIGSNEASAQEIGPYCQSQSHRWEHWSFRWRRDPRVSWICSNSLPFARRSLDYHAAQYQQCPLPPPAAGAFTRPPSRVSARPRLDRPGSLRTRALISPDWAWRGAVDIRRRFFGCGRARRLGPVDLDRLVNLVVLRTRSSRHDRLRWIEHLSSNYKNRVSRWLTERVLKYLEGTEGHRIPCRVSHQGHTDTPLIFSM